MFGPTRDGEIWRIKTNHEIREKFKSPDIVAEAKSRRLRWAGHIMRREEEKLVKKIRKGNPTGNRPRGRPKTGGGIKYERI